ncbi:MAG: PHP domain-containing protein [Proteobacteria bacterium]|nr:PHP domain-containing protein [Desulfobulbaceae bacterium]MBU4152515.1 PHP domain-containing protein [Pseudomonadota bacterium]
MIKIILAKFTISLNFFLNLTQLAKKTPNQTTPTLMSHIDLHIHSTLSDGTSSPADIISKARDKGISAISITDHDTMDAYPDAILAGKKAGIEIIPGVEITAHHQDRSLHILGFGLQQNTPSLISGLQLIQAARQDRNRRILDKLQGFNLPISFDDLPQGRGQTGRPHIAKALVDNGIVRNEQEAFAKFLRKNGAAYASRELLPVRQAIAMISNAGGVAVLAHPGSLKITEQDLTSLIRQLMDDGLCGIETYHPMNSEKTVQFLLKLCHTSRLIVTGGSDFHGREGDKSPLGEAGGKRRVPAHLLTELKSRISKNQARQESP